MTIRIDTKRGRDALAARPDPYFTRLGPGMALGFRKSPKGSETWLARWRDPEPGPDGETHETAWTPLGAVTAAFQYNQAKAAADAWFADRARGVQTHDDGGKAHTVESACREYVEDRRKVKGDRCALAAAGFFERRIYGRPKGSRKSKVNPDALASVRLDKLRTRHLAEFRDRLLEAGVARASVKREMTHLIAALNLAVSNRIIGADRRIEWEALRPLKAPASRRDLYLDREQRQALLKAAEGAVRDLIEAAALTGCRAGELVSARVSQFDARTESLTVNGKTGRRTFPLAPAAVALFKRLAKSKTPAAFLLTRDDGKPWAHSDWDELVRKAAAAARVGDDDDPDAKPLPKGVCLYTLRHSWITTALTEGMSPLEVARLVGTSLRMIDTNYGHLATATARARLAKLQMV